MSVKSGTSNDLIFYELKRSISQIKDRQYNFFQKLQSFSDDDAVIVNVMQLCKRSSFMDYYYNLNGNNCLNFLSALEEKIRNVDRSMIYYRNLIHVEKSCIYTSFLNDYYWKIITRWRLSCHKLKIETGRYARPFIPREERICETCNTKDDEHAIFICPVYHNARQNFIHLLSINNSIEDILNPKREYVIDIANFFIHLLSINNSIEDILNPKREYVIDIANFFIHLLSINNSIEDILNPKREYVIDIANFFIHLLSINNSIEDILNPKREYVIDIANLLYEIQDIQKDLV